MLAHDLKNILELVPLAMGHIKQASIEDEYPVDSPDSTIASGLRINYQIKVAHRPVDYETIDLVKKASTLWGVTDLIEKLSVGLVHKLPEDDMAKEAALKQAVFSGKTSGLGVDFVTLAKEAQELVKNYNEHVDSEDVLRYSCQGVLNKQAAVNALTSRAYATGNAEFTKLAQSVNETNTDKLSTGDLQKLAEVVTMLDKKAGLQFKGFNFYRETIMVKEADIKSSMTVLIDGKDVPYEKLQKLGNSRIGDALGKDVGSALGKSPVEDKEVLETLPLDLQKVLAGMLRNV
jgi:hypothetical protein